MKTALKEVVQIIDENNGYLSFSELAAFSSYSKRYLSKLIDEEENEMEEYGFKIIRENRQGYRLLISDPNKFDRLEYAESESQKRLKEVLLFLMDQDEPIRIETLADQLFLSQSTMNRIIKDCKIVCKKYHLKIMNQHKSGISLEGSEFDKRILRVHLRDKTEGDSRDTLQIQATLFDVLKEYDYSISDMSFNNLVYHLIVMIRRIKKHQIIKDTVSLKKDYGVEYEVASVLCQRLGTIFLIEIPENEKSFVMLHLLGKQMVKENQEIDPKVYSPVDKILEKIYTVKHLDLRNNMELRISLCLHIQPLLFRLNYHFDQENPLLLQVKREMSESYDIALVAKEVLYEHYQLLLSDDETGYLAMHFSWALLKKSEINNQVKLLVVCSTGKATAKLLQFRLMEQYHLPEENLHLTSLVQLKNRNLDEYDCIISSIPIPFSVEIPIITISPLMDDKSLEKINAFLTKKESAGKGLATLLKQDMIMTDVNLKTKAEVLHFIADRCLERFGCTRSLCEELVKREALSSTEVGNLCCLPHTVDYYPEQPMLLLIFLKRPILWQEDRVKYVFFSAMPKQDERLSEVVEDITKLVTNRQLLLKIEECPTLQQINGCLNTGK